MTRSFPMCGAPGCGIGILLGSLIRAIDQIGLHEGRDRSGFRHRLLGQAAGLRGFQHPPHDPRPGPDFCHRGQAGQARPEGHRHHGRRGRHGHRRQPFHPCGPAQHRPDGHHREQQHLRHDRRPVFPHYPLRAPGHHGDLRNGGEQLSTSPSWRSAPGRCSSPGERCTIRASSIS